MATNGAVEALYRSDRGRILATVIDRIRRRRKLEGKLEQYGAELEPFAPEPGAPSNGSGSSPVRESAGARRLGLVALLAAIAPGCSRPPPPAPPPAQEEPPPDAEAELERLTRSVIVTHRPRLRACYEDALARTPEMEGRVVLVLEIGQNGRASRVLQGRSEGLSDDVVRCLARVLKTIPFHDGAARTIRIRLPLAFSRQEPPP